MVMVRINIAKNPITWWRPWAFIKDDAGTFFSQLEDPRNVKIIDKYPQPKKPVKP